MNEVIDILKIVNYDEFRCLADKCKFTCCHGWDVSVDRNTYNKWNKEFHKCDFILKNVKTKKVAGERTYLINKKTHEPCPFLDKGGLCNIVKSFGENYLSETCKKFPRIDNVFHNKRELSLSCSCPEVVEIISNINGTIKMVSENNTTLKSNLTELKVREVLVNIMEMRNISIENKLLVGFQLLSTFFENESLEYFSSNNNFQQVIILEELGKYNNAQYIQRLVDLYYNIELNKEDSAEEINNLFLDITQEYKNVSILNNLLNDICDFANQVEIKEILDQWKPFKISFEKHNQLIENTIIAKILSNCVSNNIEDMTITFQMIIIEYLLVRYGVFLNYLIRKKHEKIYKDEEKDSRVKEILEEDVKDYIVGFSRIIGNNIEGVMEFLEDGFDKTVLDIGYFCFITLF